MRNDGIDASVGLAFSLGLFKRYQQSGLLRAEIPRMPGFRKGCTAFLRLVNGEVVSIYLEDKEGLRTSSDKETLCRLDAEKGPFEWVLIPQSASDQQRNAGQSAASSPRAFPYTTRRVPVPKIVATLREEWLSNWTPQQKDMLFTIFNMIDGTRTIEDIRRMAPFPPDLVDELLQILLQLKVIVIFTA